MTNLNDSPSTESSNSLPPPRPLWVRIGLWGLPTRASAMLFVWLSLAIAAVSVVFAVAWHPRAACGIVLVIAALWYWAAIRWVDRHGDWR